jgi:hypothetical protein
MARGLAAHYTAEALLNAAGLLGSLDLLLNPTGLASSLSAGVRDLLGLPLAALQAGSASQVCLPSGGDPRHQLCNGAGQDQIARGQTSLVIFLLRTTVMMTVTSNAVRVHNTAVHSSVIKLLFIITLTQTHNHELQVLATLTFPRLQAL